MRAIRIIMKSAVAASFLLIAAFSSFGGEGPVTPYGDYCKDCAVYGACKDPIPPGAAVQSLKKYYEARGYRLGEVYHKGRFIEAEIFQDSKQVDKVIFDRKTGRVRSVY